MRLTRTLTLLSAGALTALALPVLTAAPAEAATCTFLSCKPEMPPPVVDLTYGTPLGVDVQQETTSTTADFKVTPGDDEDTAATYECRLENVGDAVIQDWADCTVDTDAGSAKNNIGSFIKTGLAVGTDSEPQHYQFSVRSTIVGGLLNGTTRVSDPPTKFDWYVVPGEPGGEEGAPRTFVGSVPKRWHTQNWFSVDISASEAVDHFNCTFDGLDKPCGVNSGFKKRWDLFSTGAGDHTASVQAVDVEGKLDPTPVVFKFSVPQSGPRLPNLKHFKKASDKPAFLDQYVYATKKGASITRGFDKAREIVLVVSKGKGFGALNIYYNKKLIKRVNEQSSHALYRQVIVVKRWKHLKHGKLVIKADSGKRVVVEALGISLR